MRGLAIRPPLPRRPEREPRYRWCGRSGFVFGREGYLHNRVWIQRAGLGCCPPMGMDE